MLNIDFLSAFVIGLLGSGHCIGMCGGITTMLTSAIAQQQNSSKQFKLVSAYHLGRIFSYSLIGAIVGFSSSIAAKSIGVPLGFLRIVAAIFLILLGLYLGQWLMWLNRIEFIGKRVWQLIGPLSKKVIPVNTHIKAISLGAIWGWLPCGLVYSTLTWALASGNALTGATIMACFGLGTLPALFTLSIGILSIKNLLTRPIFRKFMALILISYGVYSIYIAYLLMY